MFDIVVFAGTTEGCEICSFLAKNKVSVLACVATDYGSKSLKEGEYLKIHAGRLNEMCIRDRTLRENLLWMCLQRKITVTFFE